MQVAGAIVCRLRRQQRGTGRISSSGSLRPSASPDGDKVERPTGRTILVRVRGRPVALTGSERVGLLPPRCLVTSGSFGMARPIRGSRIPASSLVRACQHGTPPGLFGPGALDVRLVAVPVAGIKGWLIGCQAIEPFH